MAFLRYDISVVGQEKVKQALRAIEAECLASNRRTISRLGVTSRAAGGGRAVTPASIARASEASARAETKAAERAERAKLSAAERAERAKTRLAEREAKKRADEEIRESKRVESNKAALQRQRSSALLAQYRHEARERDHAAMTERRGRAEIARGVKGVLGGTASRVGAVGRAGVAMAGLAGGALIATGLHGAMARGAAATNLANQLEQGKGVTAESIAKRRADVLAVTKPIRGFGQEEVMAGMGAFQGQAGEAEATMKVAPMLAKTSLATGSDITGIGEMYSAIYASLRNATGGAQKSVDELLTQTDEIGTVFAAMGQAGAIELKDFQRIGSDIASTAGKFAGAPEVAIKNAAAAAQLARQTGGSKSAEEAATALRSFGSSVASKTNAKTGQLMIGGKAVGKSLFTDATMTQLKELPDVIAEVMAATGGNIPKLQLLTGERGADITRAVTAPFLEATGGRKDKASLDLGREAIKKQFAKFGGAAMGTNERELKAEAVLAESGKQFEEQMRKMTSIMGERLLPELTKLIPRLAELTPYITQAASSMADFLGWFSENPIAGFGSVLGVALGVEIAQAGIGAIVSKAVAASVASRLAAGAAAPIAVGAASFAITTAVLSWAHDASVDKGQKAGATVNTLAEDYRGKRAAIMAGPGTAEDKARAIEAIASPALGTVSALQRETTSSISAVATTAPTAATSMMAGSYGAGGGSALLDVIRNIFQSGTEESANKGASVLQAEILKDQAAAALLLKGAAESLKGALPSVGINTSGSPTVPVK